MILVNVQLLKLPPKVKGVSVKNDDGSYTLIINSSLNHEQQLSAYAHEIRHIMRNDFDKHNVCRIEREVRL